MIFGGNYYIYKKYTPELKIRRKSVSFNAIKKLVVNGIWNSINSLGNTLNSGLDLIVTNLWLVFVFSRDEKSRILVIIKSKEK